MKAKIEKYAGYYQWFIYSSNGECVCQSSFYTRRGNAKRGLKRFLTKLRVDSVNAELKI